jgi:hypothetical protein
LAAVSRRSPPKNFGSGLHRLSSAIRALGASTGCSFQPNWGLSRAADQYAESAALMTPIAWLDGMPMRLVTFGKVRKRRRKARREAFLRS